MAVQVKRDGEPVSPVFAGQNDAFAWLLHHQGQSVSHAMTHEGYSIEPAEWSHEAVELRLWADSDSESYHARILPALQAIQHHMGADYDRERAVRFLAGALVFAAKTYAREFCNPGEWMQVFPPEVRTEAARMMLDSLEAEVTLGNTL
jgi:hypothetical protein